VPHELMMLIHCVDGELLTWKWYLTSFYAVYTIFIYAM
jgi:hypothetical protein